MPENQPEKNEAQKALEAATEKAKLEKEAREKAAAEEKAKKAAEKEAEKKAAAERKAAEKEAAKAAKEAEKQAAAAAKEKEKAELAAKREAEKKEKEEAKLRRAAEQMPKQNGIRRPKPDTRCGAAWTIFDQITETIGGSTTLPLAQVLAERQGLTEGNVKAEYSAWRRYNNVKGRVVLTQEQVDKFNAQFQADFKLDTALPSAA
jgi:flagellar biosynthesis GTPase FlhF